MDSYDLEPEPRRPDLPGQVGLYEGPDEIIDAVAADLFIQAKACVREFGDFHLALSGGALVEKLFLRLMVDPLYRALPWTRTQLWVAADWRGDSHYGATEIVDHVLRHHAGIPASQIHAPVHETAEAHAAYERELLETLGWREKGHDRLDFVVCQVDETEPVPGTGEDVGGGRLVSRYRGDAGGERVSMTPLLVGGSRFIALLASGPASRAAVDAAAGDGKAFDPVGGVQKWYLDHAAAAGEA
jgi:6-phosphogluconolactonase/glucosamine-6-phosphate isomerase/deaminase